MIVLHFSEVKDHKLLCNFVVKTGQKDCGEETKTHTHYNGPLVCLHTYKYHI